MVLICALRFICAVNLLVQSLHENTVALWTVVLCFLKTAYELNSLSHTSHLLGTVVCVALCFRNDSLFFKLFLQTSQVRGEKFSMLCGTSLAW